MKRAFVQLHLAVLLAGFTGVLGRLITLNEGLLVWYRLFFSVLLMMGLGMWRAHQRPLTRRDFWRMTAIGGIIALHWLLFYGSIKYANVSIALVCFSATGFFTAWVEPLITGRRADPVEWLLGIMVMLGIYLIFHFDRQFQTGIILGLISALMAAIFPVLNKSVLRRHDPVTVCFYELTGGWLLLSLLMPFYLGNMAPQSWIPGTTDFLWLLFLSIFCTVFAFKLSLQALTKISPFTVNLSYNLEPVYGILLAFLIFQENKQFGKGFLPGLILIFITVLLQTWRVYKRKTV